MGTLHDKRIDYVRTWLDPEGSTPAPEWDYDIIFPRTIYDAVQRTAEDGSRTLADDINDIFTGLRGKQDLLSGPDNTLVVYTNTPGELTYMSTIHTINDDRASRSNTKIPTERAVGNALDSKASLTQLNEHINNEEVHVTMEERDKIHNIVSTTEFREHLADTNVHVSESDREAWNNKADQAALDDHVNNTIRNPHNVNAHDVDAYDQNEINDMIEQLRGAFFRYCIIDYYNGNAALVEYDSPNDRYHDPDYILSYAEYQICKNNANNDAWNYSDETINGVTNPAYVKPDERNKVHFLITPISDPINDEKQKVDIWVYDPNDARSRWRKRGSEIDITHGDMVVRKTDSSLCVWIHGQFLRIYTLSNSNMDDESSRLFVWSPVFNATTKVLEWEKVSITSDTTPSDIDFSQMEGEAGKDGVGVPIGGALGDIIVKSGINNYDTAWVSLIQYFNEYVTSIDKVPDLLKNYNNLINKPNIYGVLGEDENGLISQKGINNIFNSYNQRLTDIENIVGPSGGTGGIAAELREHLEAENPHGITPEMIGAISATALLAHTNATNNPHSVTKSQIGLGNVDNTSDINKPVSTAQQQALTTLQNLLENKVNDLEDSLGDKLIKDVSYEAESCTFTFNHKDGTTTTATVPLVETFSTIYFDNVTKEFVITTPDSEEHRTAVHNLITEYVGANGDFVNVEVENGVIRATIPNSAITSEKLATDIALRGIPTAPTPLTSDGSTQIATTQFVRNLVVDNLTTDSPDRPLSAKMGSYLAQTRITEERVMQILEDTPLTKVIDALTSTDATAALSANMGRSLDLAKAPMVHTSNSGSTYGRASIDLFGHVRASDTDPLMDGGDTGELGTDNGRYANADHRHPTDTTRAPLNFPEEMQYILTGVPKAVHPPVDSNDERIATTKWVKDHMYDFCTESEIVSIVDEAWDNVMAYPHS